MSILFFMTDDLDVLVVACECFNDILPFPAKETPTKSIVSVRTFERRAFIQAMDLYLYFLVCRLFTDKFKEFTKTAVPNP